MGHPLISGHKQSRLGGGEWRAGVTRARSGMEKAGKRGYIRAELQISAMALR